MSNLSDMGRVLFSIVRIRWRDQTMATLIIVTEIDHHLLW